MMDWRVFHRSFEIYDPANPKYRKEVQGFDNRTPMMRTMRAIEDAKYREMSKKAFRLDSTGLTEVRILTKEGQDFPRFASAFERNRSSLCGHEGCDPVIDGKGNLVAHLMWARSMDIFFQRYVGGDDSNGDVIVDPFDADGDGRMDDFDNLDDAIDQGCEIRIALRKKTARNRYRVETPDPLVAREYTRDASLAQQAILIIIDPTGLVLHEVKRRSLDGVTSSWVDPLALIGIGKLGFVVVRGVVGFTLKRGATAMAKIMLRRQVSKALAEEARRETARSMRAVAPVARRVTSRGMGIPKPPRPATPGGPPTPRISSTGRPEFTLDEMEQYLNAVMRSHPELMKLVGARNLKGEALRQELMAAVKAWQARTGQKFEILPRGAVQRLTGETGNFATIRNGKLMIEQQVVDDLAHFQRELVHEFAAHSMGGRVAKIYIVDNERWHALDMLEMWLKHTGSFQYFRDLLGGV